MKEHYHRESWKIGLAYAGIIVGAGFSTGQEVLQFFSSFGLWSFAGVLLSAFTIMFIGRQASKLGYRLNAESHVLPIYALFGEKLGKVVDYILVFFLYGLATVMIAGSGATFNESFGIEPWLGIIFLIIAVSVTLLLDFSKIVAVVGGITPILVLAVIIITGYNMMNPQIPFSEVNDYADITRTPTGFWWLDAITYSGTVLACAFSFLSIMGSEATKHRAARRGAIYGGLVILLLMLLVNGGILSTITQANEVALPTMAMAQNMHPTVAVIFSIVILLLIYNSVVGLMYPFLTRFTTAYSKKYKLLLIASMVISYLMTFVGFVELVNIVYPILGYVGITIGIALTVRWLMNKFSKKKLV
ncbi:YkvI family membrane protein [Corticicoccus populi]|uniref:Membrane protein YkvI n=1 Tax=Corticicoccus populi TaxID=1812821 RepID=A0ABW5WYB8_9STAP